MTRFATAVLAALAAVSSPALAQSPPCGDHDKIVRMLETKYKEIRAHAGIMAGQAAMIEVFTSEGGTFTILVTATGGPTCIVAAGESWQDYEKKKPEAGL